MNIPAFKIIASFGIAAVLLLSACQENPTANKEIAGTCCSENAMATCSGTKSCTACKNCKYCKHCSKDGGSCGVCK